MLNEADLCLENWLMQFFQKLEVAISAEIAITHTSESKVSPLLLLHRAYKSNTKTMG
jgi:hypothetical protein